MFCEALDPQSSGSGAKFGKKGEFSSKESEKKKEYKRHQSKHSPKQSKTHFLMQR